MKVVVFDKGVKENLALFRHLIHRQTAQEQDHFRIARKSYEALIDCKTGQFHFLELEPQLLKEPLSDQSKWKKVIIRLCPEDGGAFELAQADQTKSFDCENLSKEAYCLLTKTIHILNQLSYDPKQGHNPFWVLRQIAHMDLLLSEEEEGVRNFVQKAWYNVDRKDAEKLLEEETVGTYLFSKSEFSQKLEDALNKDRLKPVTCFTLTYKPDEKKIEEKTLVLVEGKWMFYDDDPLLEGDRYPTVYELFCAMPPQMLLRPLTKDRSGL